MNEHTKINQAFWDEVAPHHARSEFYAVERFVADPDRLAEPERGELGEVAGRSICHLQCHIGLDSLALAYRGAEVTGVDLSAESLKIGRELAARTGIPATFVQSDVLTAADTLATRYDIVFTTRGVLMWVSDLTAWARTCARLLRPGGVFYLLDVHPLAMVLEERDPGFRLTGSYFGGEPNVVEADASYAVRDVGLTHRETHEWVHPVGAVVSALIEAGIMIDFLHEHPAHDQAPGTAGLPALYSVRGRLAGS
ncbi:class I SAM-dependent methyltransferase [Microlunatus parietis]|uniref:SAM-dependent methyltransferase n=1 Tax=Microlunatus parietis TaxID=682979 RepID=A0A7Y9LBX5_9ACTN|nr:class I SAM-dependent methyltransferase [Microlunatus parietis]NYE71308.1 SAM-dependent methyltransferase [Microlunatus parietis]